MRELRVNAYSAVDKSKIRRETVDGRDYIIVPSATLPPNIVMNGILYPAEETKRTYTQLEGKPAPLGHPKDGDGKWISASDWGAIHANHVGAFNRNVTLGEDGRIHAEKWIDIEFAGRTAKGPELLAAIESEEPMSTSIAVFLLPHPAEKGLPYDYVAEYKVIDHDAFLIGEAPAAGVEQGVGLFVNVDTGTLDSMTNQEKHEVLRAAGNARWPNYYAWLADFTDTIAIFELGQRGDNPNPVNNYVAVDYTLSGAVAVLDAVERPARRKNSWQLLANSVFNRGALNFDVQELPIPVQEAVDMTPEQIQALREGIAADLKVNAADAVTGAMAPVLERLSALEALAGKGEKAEIEALRAQAAEVIGVDAAADLTVNGLRSMLAKTNPANPLPTGQLHANRSGADKAREFKPAAMPE